MFAGRKAVKFEGAAAPHTLFFFPGSFTLFFPGPRAM